MNASFSILQKIKTQFLQATPNKADYQVAFAPFAFTLSNDDFYFLRNSTSTGTEARKYLKEQSEFSFLANSMLKNPNLWQVDGDNLLSTAYRQVLDNARLVDPDQLTTAEAAQVKKAKAVLYNANGTESAKYLAYKDYATRYADLDRQLIDLNAQKTTLAASDSAGLEKWTLDLQALTQRRQDLKIEWEVKGAKSKIEAAKASFDTLVFGKSAFVQRWQDARSVKTAPPNLLTDEYGVDFLATTCVPNAICDAQAPIWKKLTLGKAEIAQLAQSFAQEVPAAVQEAFGDLQPELDAISFEYCLLDIQRPWFDESLLTSRLWAFADANQRLSTGDDSLGGLLPAYPAKIILAKSIDLQFSPQSAVNEDIKTRLRNGSRLFFGPLLIKTIPSNLPDAQISGLRVQPMSTPELAVIAKVASQAAPGAPPVDAGRRGQVLSLLARQPSANLRRTVQAASLRLAVRPLPTMPLLRPVASPVIAAAAVRPAPAPMVAAAMPLGARAAVLNAGLVWGVPPGRFGGILTAPPIRPPVTPPIAPPPPVPPTPPPPLTVNLVGRVLGATGQALAVAEVQVMSLDTAAAQSVLSGDDGRYALPPLEAGRYQLKLRKSGFVTQDRPLTLQADTTLDLLLEAQAVPTETFQVIGVICRKLPRLPDPLADAHYI